MVRPVQCMTPTSSDTAPHPTQMLEFLGVILGGRGEAALSVPCYRIWCHTFTPVSKIIPQYCFFNMGQLQIRTEIGLWCILNHKQLTPNQLPDNVSDSSSCLSTYVTDSHCCPVQICCIQLTDRLCAIKLTSFKVRNPSVFVNSQWLVN